MRLSASSPRTTRRSRSPGRPQLLAATLGGRHRLRDPRRRRHRHDGTADVVAGSGREPPVRCVQEPEPARLRLRRPRRLRRLLWGRGDVVMADDRTTPATSSSTTECSRRVRLRVRLAVHPGRDCRRLPALQALAQPRRESCIRLLFRHGYNDTTNAFKAYRREVIDAVRAAARQPLQPDRRAAALKAVVRGYRYAIVPTRGPTAKRAPRSSSSRRWVVGTCSSSCTCSWSRT